MKFYVIAYGNPEDKRQGIFSINFDEKTKNIKNGDLAVFSIDNVFYMRRFFEKNKTIILSHIDSSYEPIIITSSSNFKTYGKLVVTINEI